MLDLADSALQEQPKDNLMVAIYRAWPYISCKIKCKADRTALHLILRFIQHCWSWSTQRSGYTLLLFVQVVPALFKIYHIYHGR